MDLLLKSALIHQRFVQHRLERLTHRGWKSFDGTGADATAREIKELRAELEEADEYVAQAKRFAKRHA